MHKNNTANLAGISIFSAFLIFISIAITGCASTDAVENTSAQDSQSEDQDVKTKTVQADSAAVVSLDDDIDGVVNTDDQCKDTPPNTLVDIKGCALDTDGDKVADSRDACRGTPRGVKVDARGCGFDDDQDGVPNYRDRCSNTIKDVSVDGNGCEWDSDNDGVVDSKDLCAGTPPGVKVEYMGCHIIEVVTLRGVHFNTGSDELSASAQKILGSVAATLREHPRMRVEVAGHTDNTGSDAINQELSLKRARSATKFLVNLGINTKVLSTKGYAASQPIASNDSQEGRSQNRRVEMRFVEID
ncbi:OmpA family protein [Kaarinaea lacus]